MLIVMSACQPVHPQERICRYVVRPCARACTTVGWSDCPSARACLYVNLSVRPWFHLLCKCFLNGFFIGSNITKLHLFDGKYFYGTCDLEFFMDGDFLSADEGSM
jgi:hypothetical protein